MRAAGERLEREPGDLSFTLPPPGGGEESVWRGCSSHHLPRRRRRQAVRVRFHPPAARFVELRQWNIDAAFLGLGPALDHRPIGLADLALLEQLAERGKRLAVAAEHQAAGGILVEPVRQRRIARQPEAQGPEIVVERRAALRAAMHRESGRLVDYQHQPVAVEQPAEHLFRCHRNARHSGAPATRIGALRRPGAGSDGRTRNPEPSTTVASGFRVRELSLAPRNDQMGFLGQWGTGITGAA